MLLGFTQGGLALGMQADSDVKECPTFYTFFLSATVLLSLQTFFLLLNSQ